MRNSETPPSRRRPAHQTPAANGAPNREAAKGARATAIYIAQMTDELIKLARLNRLDLLAYLLEMAKLEAELCARSNATGRRAR